MIDLRSDTVTLPTPEMRDFMFKAELGDDVYGEDPSVNQLQDLAAQMTGHQAALYVASGTQGNLISILTHCQRGDEYIAGQQAHTYRFEGGGAAVLGSVQPQPIPFNERGELDLNDVRAVIKPDDHHFARTRLICLENTQAGRALDLAYLSEFHEFAQENGLATHLDGARVFNAAIASKVDVSQIAKPFGSISLCLSKGLGCPVGSIICADKAFIDEARKWRKMLGGGMRQAGMMAAAGIFALNNHIERLASDHENAEVLARELNELGQLTVTQTTNMVFISLESGTFDDLRVHLLDHGIMISDDRLVVHMDLERDDIVKVAAAFRSYFE